MSVWLQNMNDEQLQVIAHVEGPLQVLAQAGSGKTRALVHRVARLVLEVGISAERIFAVTFSRAGAGEMEKRLRMLGVDANVQTWHAFALRVLREDSTRYAQWEVDEKDRAKFHVKDALGFKQLNWKDADLTKVRRFIGYCKANLWFPDSEECADFARKEFGRMGPTAVRAYALSQASIEAAGILTFDDMLVYCWQHLLIEENRDRWAAHFDFVLQDEAQDQNQVQRSIGEQLARTHRNYMIVGDPAQSIYGFRGSKPDYIMSFEEEWEATRVAMFRNYRSGKAIVAFANAIIRSGKVRLPEDMSAERGVEGSAKIVAAADLEDEAKQFVAHVQALNADAVPYKDITALFRTNAQSRALEDALLRTKTPYVIVGGTNFYNRKEVKDLLGYLRVAAQQDPEGDGVKRCINAPFRFLGAKFTERLMARGAPDGDWAKAVQAVASEQGIQSRQVQSANEWAALITSTTAIIESSSEDEGEESARMRSPAWLLQRIVRDTKYLEWIRKEEGDESIESSHQANVRELLRVAEAFSTVPEMLDYVQKNIEDSTKQKRGQKDRVTLMSIHKSKGLEWPHVWIVGCNEKILPHAKGDIEEERRLMYVAVTRARETVTCSWVARLATAGGVSEAEPSRFLAPLRAAATSDEDNLVA